MVAKEKFSKILAAYETLSDSKQRDMYDLQNDYSSQGNWKGFTQENYGEYDRNPKRRRRPRGTTNRERSQGFWDSGFDPRQDAEEKKKEDPFDEFFFTGNRSASNRDADLTRGDDLTIDLFIDFMDAVTGCNHTATVVKHVVCNKCNGTRAAPDSSPSL